MSLTEDVTRHLSRLGSRPAKVIGKLRARGFRGRKNSIWSCPVAKYVDDAFPAARYCSGVSASRVVVVDIETGEAAEVPFSPALAESIRQIDTGKHPDLVAA